MRVAGSVQRWDTDDIYLDDGSGLAQVRVRESTEIARPKLVKGQFLTVQGVVTQYNGSFRVLPRYQRDLSLLPALLPKTGER